MSALDDAMGKLSYMDDTPPGWLSGDKELVAQLCRCCLEFHYEFYAMRKELNEIKKNLRKKMSDSYTKSDAKPAPSLEEI